MDVCPSPDTYGRTEELTPHLRDSQPEVERQTLTDASFSGGKPFSLSDSVTALKEGTVGLVSTGRPIV